MGIEKHTKITGSSTVSWKDAIVKTIQEISETTNYLTSVKIIDQRAKITVDKITEYFVDLDVAYMVDSDR
ncbi:MAG: dodecin domain-containing protein [Clostridia bacterium]|nr:dodecin domain-containing protein [Clostridia bacterium]